LLFETSLGSRCNRTKRFRIVYCNVRQHFAINLDLGFVQAVYQAAVGQTVQTSRRVDTRDPQRTKLALALATITVGVLTGFDDRLLGGLE